MPKILVRSYGRNFEDGSAIETIGKGCPSVPMTTIATTLEFQRDWANKEHYDALINLYREHGGAYGNGIEYAYSMAHKAPQSAKNPHVVSRS